MTSHVATREAGSRAAASRRAASTPQRVSQTASWPPAFAWGAGLILAAIGAGSIVGTDAPFAARLAGYALFPLGLVFLAWGAVVLAKGRLLAPRTVIAGSVLGVTAAVTALILDPVGVSVVSVAAASLLLIAVGVIAAAATRRTQPAATPRMGMIGLLVVAAVIAVLVTPALAATEVARVTSDNGGVPVVLDPHRH